MTPPVRLLGLAAAASIAVLAAPSPASAGRVVATQHAFDASCARSLERVETDGCHGLRAITTWARATAPDKTKPLLILDGAARDVATGYQRAWAPVAPPSSQVIDPAAPYAQQLPITTDAYSAVVFASASAADFTAWAARNADLRRFLAEGGGLVFLAGGPASSYYGAGPLPSPVAGGTTPTALTVAAPDLGLSLGDRDCCAPIGAFAEPPDASVLRVAERDGEVRPVTVFGEGVAFGSGGGVLVEPPTSLQGSRSCASRRRFPIHVRRLPGVRYRTVRITVADRAPIVLRGNRIRAQIDLRGLPRGRFVLQIEVESTAGLVYRGIRSYRTCHPRKLKGNRNPL